MSYYHTHSLARKNISIVLGRLLFTSCIHRLALAALRGPAHLAAADAKKTNALQDISSRRNSVPSTTEEVVACVPEIRRCSWKCIVPDGRTGVILHTYHKPRRGGISSDAGMPWNPEKFPGTYYTVFVSQHDNGMRAMEESKNGFSRGSYLKTSLNTRHGEAQAANRGPSSTTVLVDKL